MAVRVRIARSDGEVKVWTVTRIKVEDGVLHLYARDGYDEDDLHYPLTSILFYETREV